MDHSEHNKPGKRDHAHHIEEFKKKFWICLIVTIPMRARSTVIVALNSQTLRKYETQAVQFSMNEVVTEHQHRHSSMD